MPHIRFGLRSVIVFVALCALLMAVPAYMRYQFRRHWQAAAYLDEVHGVTLFNDNDESRPVWHLQPSKLTWFDDITDVRVYSTEGEPPKNGLLENLAILTNIEHLEFNDYPLTDEQLSFLRDFKALKSLTLWNTQVTGRGIPRLNELPRLEELNLLGNEIVASEVVKLGHSHTEVSMSGVHGGRRLGDKLDRNTRRHRRTISRAYFSIRPRYREPASLEGSHDASTLWLHYYE